MYANPIAPLPVEKVPDVINHWRHGNHWWERAAAQAYDRGNHRVITARTNKEVYLLRFWLTPPQAGPDQGLESGDSVLLHYFVRGDDDEALHDHPWDFTTTILCGGYWECLPPHDWANPHQLHAVPGPAFDAHSEFRGPGMTVVRERYQLHSVGKVLPGTFTLVRTGTRAREWGFHPPGKPWTPWRTFLGVA